MQLAETARNSANQLKRPLQAQEGPGGTLNSLLDVVLDSPPPLAQQERLCVGRLLPSTTQQKAVGLRRLATPSPFFTPLLGGPALVKKGPMQRPCLALFVWVGVRVRACAHARVRAAGCSESAQVRCGTTQGQGNVVRWMMLSTKAQVTKQMCRLILCQQQFSLFAVTFFFLRPLMRGSSGRPARQFPYPRAWVRGPGRGGSRVQCKDIWNVSPPVLFAKERLRPRGQCRRCAIKHQIAARAQFRRCREHSVQGTGICAEDPLLEIALFC
mmetsp:Transcript_98671/g.166089  ORF Transcript_98671/g.166089 Transcript_98671/m.166089 type:complete len:270 (-) Transcript_98671:240-1049(-)